MTKQYNSENIRILLIEGFSDKQLRDFCFDKSRFKQVYNQLAENTGKTEIVRRLVEHAAQQEAFEHLLDYAKKNNPAKYKRHEPYYEVTSSHTLDKDDQTTNITTLGALESVDDSVKHQLKTKYENQVRNAPENAQYHFALGLSYLDLGLYRSAIDSLNVALEKGPRHADIFYYLALAHIGGRRPKTLQLPQIRDIENYLQASVELNSCQAHYLYLWSLIKYDFYLSNGLRVPAPSIDKLLQQAQQCEIEPNEIVQMLKHSKVPKNVITLLGIIN